MMTKRVAILVVLACAAAGVVAFWSHSRRDTSVAIGLITPLTGEVADLGAEMLECAKIGIEQAESRHPGLRLRLVARDDQNSAVAAATAAKGLAQHERAVAVIAAGTSAMAKAEIQALQGAAVPVLTSTATASDLGATDHAVFRVIPPNNAQGQALANYARQISAKSAAIVFQQEDYSLDLKAAFEKAFIADGGQIAFSATFEGDETNFRGILRQISTSPVDVVACLAQHVPVSRFLVRSKEFGVRVPILSGETAYTDKLLEATAGSADLLFVTGPPVDVEHPSAELKPFLDAYERRTGKKPGIYGCYTYDTVTLLATTLASGKPGESGGDLRQSLSQVRGFKGVTGMIDFVDAASAAKQYRIFTVKNGKFVPAPDHATTAP